MIQPIRDCVNNPLIYHDPTGHGPEEQMFYQSLETTSNVQLRQQVKQKNSILRKAKVYSEGFLDAAIKTSKDLNPSCWVAEKAAGLIMNPSMDYVEYETNKVLQGQIDQLVYYKDIASSSIEHGYMGPFAVSYAVNEQYIKGIMKFSETATEDDWLRFAGARTFDVATIIVSHKIPTAKPNLVKSSPKSIFAENASKSGMIKVDTQLFAKKTGVGNTGKFAKTSELNPTHEITMSKKEFSKFTEQIKTNGIQEPIKYVEYNGQKYVVDGHHRLKAAKQLKTTDVPIEEVSLPYKGYKTFEDLFW